MSDIYIPFEDQVISHIVPMNRCPEEVTERLLTRVREMAKRTGQNLDEESTKRLASEIWELAMRICYPSENEEYITKAELLSTVPTILEPWTEQMETRFSFYKTSMEHLFPERFYFWTEWERIWWDEKTKWKPQDEWEATWPKRRLICEFLFVLERMSPEEMEKMIERERKIIEREENDLGLSPYEKSSFERKILTGKNHTDLPEKLFNVLRIREAIQNGTLLYHRVKSIEEMYGITLNNDNRMREFVDVVTNWEQRAHIPGARSLKDILCEADLIDAEPAQDGGTRKIGR